MSEWQTIAAFAEGIARDDDDGERHEAGVNEPSKDDPRRGSDGPMSLDLDSITRPRTSDARNACDLQHENEEENKEREDMMMLRLENDLLRKKVKELERVARGERKINKLVVDETELARIDQLLKKAEDAKAEAMSYATSSSREKLGQDVKTLHAILKKAKVERQAFKKKIKETEDTLQLERQNIEKEEIRFQVDREIFAKIIQDDRDSYKFEVNLLVQKMTDLMKKHHELYTWANEQQEVHLREIRKLTRALGRTKKMADEQASKNMEVLHHVRQVHSGVFPPPSISRLSTPSA